MDEIKTSVVDKISNLYYNFKLDLIQKDKANFVDRLNILANELKTKGVLPSNALNKSIEVENYKFTSEEEYFVLLALKGIYFMEIIIMLPSILNTTSTNSQNNQCKRVVYFCRSLDVELSFLNQVKQEQDKNC